MVTNYDFQIIKNNFNKIKEEIKKVINDDKVYNEFIKGILLYALEQNEVVLLVPNKFIKNTILSNYENTLKTIFNQVLKTNFDLVFLTNEEMVEREEKNNKNQQVISFFSKANTNTLFLFENYVVGPFNKAAYNAVQSVFNNRNWNPIFVSGGVGLGKTHLLNAVGNEFIKKYPNSNVLFISCDDFIHEFYKALSSGNNKEIEALKDKYCACDLLLIDDIQFLAKKEKINEIFFTIFNHNVSKGKIIIMSSDKAPDQLENFQSRMKSRFNSGLYIEIKKPSVEMVVSILEEKVKKLQPQFIFPKETINYIARRKHDDIRKLQGYLNVVHFYALNNLSPGAIITVDIVQKATKVSDQEEIVYRGFDVDPNIVIEQISYVYGINPKDTKSKSRVQSIVNCRNVCMYALRNKFNMKFNDIGKYFSNRNHSTIMEAIKKVENLFIKDPKAKEFVENIYKNI